jgi:hypothetical protein
LVATLLGGALLGSYPVDESCERTTGQTQIAHDTHMIVFRENVETLRREALSFDLKHRTAGVAEKLTPFSKREASLPFCDVAAHRDASAPKLRSQSVLLLTRKTRSHRVDRNGQVQRPLKCNKILE